MDERDERPMPQGGGDSVGDARGQAVGVGWTFDWVNLALADDEAMWRQAAAFRDLAEELRAIVRGVHPDANLGD